MIASDPQKMLFAHASWPVKTDCQSPFTPSVKRRDDPNTPQFHWYPVGTISVLRGRLALELPPCAGALKTAIRSLATKTWSHPVTRLDAHFAAATIERWYYAARHGHADPVRALRRAVRKDCGKISLAAPLAERLILQYHDHPDWTYQLHYDNLAALVKVEPALGRLPSYATIKRYMQARGLAKKPRFSSQQRPGQARRLQRRETREVRSYEATHGIVAEVLGRGVIRKLTYDVFRSARDDNDNDPRCSGFLKHSCRRAASCASGQDVVDQEHRATS